MAMLERYRKTGGFYQLLSLLETCPTAKRDKFLEIIRSESPAWADAVRTRLLDIPKIYSWPDETLAEIFGTLQDLTVAVALHAGDEKLRARVFAFMTHGRRRKIEDLMGLNKPSPGEIATMHFKIIETVRKMAHDGHLRFEKLAPDLDFDDDIEEQLNKSQLQTAVQSAPTGLSKSDFKIEYEPGTEPVEDARPVAASADNSEELLQLKRRVTDLGKENAILRHELSIAKNKLEQIKKIA